MWQSKLKKILYVINDKIVRKLYLFNLKVKQHSLKKKIDIYLNLFLKYWTVLKVIFIILLVIKIKIKIIVATKHIHL